MPDSLTVIPANLAGKSQASKAKAAESGSPMNWPDPEKDERMRRWACKVASELPSRTDDALMVLKLAEGLINWSKTGGSTRSTTV